MILLLRTKTRLWKIALNKICHRFSNPVAFNTFVIMIFYLFIYFIFFNGLKHHEINIFKLGKIQVNKSWLLINATGLYVLDFIWKWAKKIAECSASGNCTVLVTCPSSYITILWHIKLHACRFVKYRTPESKVCE